MYPGEHAPLHAAVLVPAADPNLPAGHATHTAAPARLYLPATHTEVVELVDPEGHAYPAAQLPLQVRTVSPAVLPKYPASHGPVHAAVSWAVVFPNRPTGHGVQLAAPVTLYVPAAHITAVSLTLPAGHAKPAVQVPLHTADVSPVVLPYLPPGHGAVHAADDSAVAAPYTPALQLVQVTAPARL